MGDNIEFTSFCPVPLSTYPQILMAHGGGGTLMQQLIETLFVPAFRNPELARAHDGACLDVGGRSIAFTTDSYVVHPLFFPGGDIGTLAINGTVNDLVMCGALPRWLSAGLILEEGLPMETLCRVVDSMRRAATAAGVELVTGDTKVVDRGKGDGLFVNTAGIGIFDRPVAIGPESVREGDCILINGDLGRHGMAIMSVREGLAFESPITSDCASLIGPVRALLDAGLEVHCLRDLTRGGLVSALNEIAQTARVRIEVTEDNIPVSEAVQGACEMLGLDPLYVANEGRFVAFVTAEQGEKALHLLRDHPLGQSAAIVGTVGSGADGMVTLRSRIGARRVLDRLSGEQLPRIC